jgi:hypothetical protein
MFFPAADTIAFSEGGVESMRLNSSGNVGIGTVSPGTNKLAVNGSQVLLANGQLKFADATNNAISVIQNGGASTVSQMEFITSSTERMRITSDGEVLVGGTTSINAANGCLTLQRTNDQPYLSFFRNDTSINPTNSLGDIYYYGNDTTSSAVTALAAIRVLATDTHAAGDNPTDIVFQTTPDGSATIAEAGRITQSGAYVLKGGNTSPGGIGITFPATQSASSNANTLDDYEEGTFTPVFNGTGSNPTVTSGTATGAYIKVGRLVWVSIQMAGIGYTGGSGSLFIAGLPFAASTVNGELVSFYESTNNFPAGKTGLWGYTSNNETNIYLGYAGGTAGFSTVLVSTASSWNMYTTFCYRATA